MKKSLFFSLIALFLLAIIPNVSAAENYGTVKDITKETGDSLSSGQGTIETKGNTTTIRYSAATFKMLEEDKNASGGERPGPAAWIGFEVTEPENDKDSKFKVTMPDNKTTEIKASSFKDYVGITPNNLKAALLRGTILTYKYSFDWNEDGDADQFVIIQVDPEEITLLPTSGGESVWSPDIAQQILKEQNPNTSDIHFLPLLGLLVIGGCGLIYGFKRA